MAATPGFVSSIHPSLPLTAMERRPRLTPVPCVMSRQSRRRTNRDFVRVPKYWVWTAPFTHNPRTHPVVEVEPGKTLGDMGRLAWLACQLGPAFALKRAVVKAGCVDNPDGPHRHRALSLLD